MAITSRITAHKQQRMHPAHVVVKGERFLVEKEDEDYYVTHPVWSLVGTGATVQDAIQDMQVEAQELLHAVQQIPPEQVAADMQALKTYLHRLI